MKASFLFILTGVLLVAAVGFGQAKPEGELIGVIQGFLAKDFNTEWSGVEKLPLIRWAALPPQELQTCLPDGNCFARQGALTIGGRNITAIAAGARTFTVSLYLRNTTTNALFGEAAILAALRDASFTAELARCPVPGTTGGTNWYKLHSPKANAGVLSIQTVCNGAACEGLIVTQGEMLPPLQANQVKLYSEQCGPGADRKPVSSVLPHEALAQALAAFVPPAASPGPYDWKTLASLKTDVKWPAQGAAKISLTSMNDPNPFGMTAGATLAGRSYSAIASGSQTQALAVYLEEGGSHAPREDVFGVLRAQGFTIQLARCGPVYTESSHTWYRVTSARTRPVMLKESINRDGARFSQSYAIRLDGTLPARDSRDRDPGVGGCQ